MIRSQLRLYSGPDASDATAEPASECCSRPSIPVKVGELVQVLTHATHAKRAWLEDFQHEEVLLSPDLYEIMMAYQHYHRPSA
ncbi:MAG TPA: hypothetical protein VIY86_13015 [Pirellulaceae bacterium]